MARNAKPKIEAAALAAFGEQGVDGATTRDIAARAGVSEGALYRHYKGKEELATALFMETHDRLSAVIREAAAMEAPFAERVSALVTAYCGLADEDWARFSFHLLSLHRFLPYYAEDGRDPVSEVERFLQGAVERGDLASLDVEPTAAMALGVVTQLAQNKAYGRVKGGLSAHAPAAARAILAVIHSQIKA